MCGLRILAAKNSRKRIDARSPAAATSAGNAGEPIGISSLRARGYCTIVSDKRHYHI